MKSFPIIPKNTLVILHILFILPVALICQSSVRVKNLMLEPILFLEGPAYAPNSKAYLSFDMLPGSDMHFFTAQLTNLNSGEFKIVALNIPLPSISDTQRISYMIDLSGLNFDLSTSFECGYNASSEWVDYQNFLPGANIDLYPKPTIFRIPDGAGEIPPIAYPFHPPKLPLTPPVIEVESVYRGDSVPNIDLRRDSIRDDWKACGPAAAGNSLQYLVARHAELSGDTTSLRQKVDSLKKYMHRNDSIGVRFDSMVVGKLRLIDALELPIRVKYWTIHDSADAPELVSTDPRFGHFADNDGFNGAPPNFDYLRNEIDDGEDVEVHLGYYRVLMDSIQIGDTLLPGQTVMDTIVIEDADGQPIDTIVQIQTGVEREGGHWMVATGYAEVYTDDEYAMGIWINEDTDQDSTGGTRSVFYKWEDPDDPYTTPILREFDETSNDFVIYQGAVESVVSESYDPDVEFNDLTSIDCSYRPIDYLPGGMHDYPFDAYFSFSIPPATDLRYLNVGASIPGSDDIKWIIRNMPLPIDILNEGSVKFDGGVVTQNQPLPSTMRFFVSLGDPKLEFNPASFIDLVADPVDHFITNGLNADPDSMIPNIQVPDILLYPGPVTSGDYRPSDEVPNVDLDTSNDPTDERACGPAAAANSLKWLDSFHADSLEIPLDLRNTLDSLKDLMNWNAQDGVTDEDLIKGKLAFIDEYQLPIHVKFQAQLLIGNINSPDPTYGHSATDERPDISLDTWPELDWIANEMENNEDVEVLLGEYECQQFLQPGDPIPEHHIVEDTIINYDDMGDPIDTVIWVFDTTMRRRIDGHWINLTGAHIYDGQGYGWVSYKDDDYQDGQGGVAQRHAAVAEDAEGRPFLYDITSYPGRTRQYIETVVSESYDPNVTFCTKNITSTSDTGKGSLRDAMECSAMGDTIPFADIMKGDTVTLSSTPIIVDHAVTIMANPADSIFIRAAEVQRIFIILENVNVKLIGLHLIGSSIDGPGRSILNAGNLTLQNVTFETLPDAPAIGTQVENVGGKLDIIGETKMRED